MKSTEKKPIYKTVFLGMKQKLMAKVSSALDCRLEIHHTDYQRSHKPTDSFRNNVAFLYLCLLHEIQVKLGRVRDWGFVGVCDPLRAAAAFFK